MAKEFDSSESVDQTHQDTPVTAESNGEQDIAKLMKALETERASRKQLEAELKSRTKKEEEFNAQLEKYKQIDPERYTKLLEAEQKREEEDLLRKKNYEELKTRHQLESDASRKQATEWQGKYENLVVDTAIRNAFFENGGKKSTYSIEDGGEEIPPVDAMLNVLRSRIRLEDNKVIVLNRTGEVELNNEGRPKTLTEKMMELRKGSMGALFERQSNASGGGMTPIATHNGQQYKVFSKEQARNGKASIDELASGKAFVQ